MWFLKAIGKLVTFIVSVINLPISIVIVYCLLTDHSEIDRNINPNTLTLEDIEIDNENLWEKYNRAYPMEVRNCFALVVFMNFVLG